MLQKECALTFEGRIKRGGEQWTVGWTKVWATSSWVVLNWDIHLIIKTLFVNKISPITLLSHLIQAQRIIDEIGGKPNDEILLKCEIAGISANSVPARKAPQFL